MRKLERNGFTLIELMIVVSVLGTIAAVAIPNYMAMGMRAKEGSTKANMHKLQIAAEDYGVENFGEYADQALDVMAQLPNEGADFRNPFDGMNASSWEDRADISADPTATPGIVSYADSANTSYNIKGVGEATSGVGFPMELVLSSRE